MQFKLRVLMMCGDICIVTCHRVDRDRKTNQMFESLQLCRDKLLRTLFSTILHKRAVLPVACFSIYLQNKPQIIKHCVFCIFFYF